MPSYELCKLNVLDEGGMDVVTICYTVSSIVLIFIEATKSCGKWTYTI